jgi:uncharacterized protein (TIGR03083 family)
LGEWTLRELVGHTYRNFVNLETYAATPGNQVDQIDPVDYFLAVRGGQANLASVAQRGREAGQELGEEPVAWANAAARRTAKILDGLPDDAILITPVGGMRLIDYLPCRIFELTVHTLDVAEAIGVKEEPPSAALKVTQHLMADLAVANGVGSDLAFAVTGRLSLPSGYSVL